MMGKAEMLVKPPFRLPEHAVRAAFAVDANPICEVSRFFADLRGGTVKLIGDDPLTPWDHATQAGMILALMQRHLNRDQQSILVGHHARPVTEEARRLKEKCLWRVLNLVRPELSHVPLHYLVDVVNEWAGLPRAHEDLWWADHLDVDYRTIQNWRLGRKKKGKRFRGIRNLLYAAEQDCYSALQEPMAEAGLVSSD